MRPPSRQASGGFHEFHDPTQGVLIRSYSETRALYVRLKVRDNPYDCVELPLRDGLVPYAVVQRVGPVANGPPVPRFALFL